MNKYKKSLRNIVKCYFAEYQNHFSDIDLYNLENLVEKETPIKPIYLGCFQYECPNCRVSFDSTSYRNRIRKHQPYCDECGQKLDWSDHNDNSY